MSFLDRLRRRATAPPPEEPPPRPPACVKCGTLYDPARFTEADKERAGHLNQRANNIAEFERRAHDNLGSASRDYYRLRADNTARDAAADPDGFKGVPPECDECRKRTCVSCRRRFPFNDFLLRDQNYALAGDCPECRQHLTITPDDYALIRTLAGDPLPSPTGTDPEPGSVTLGTDEHGEPVTLDRATRNRHLYTIGRTGSGKSTLLRHLAMQDMERGAGLALLDPHGDIAEQLAGYVPHHRLDDVIYFDPTDEHAPAFNLLAMPFEPAKLTSDIVSAFKMFFGESSFGPRMEHLMRHALLTLLCDRESHSIADLRALLIDEGTRAAIVARISDDDLRSFWLAEFPSMSKDAAGPILNKIATVLVPGSALKRVFSARTNALDIPHIMDSGKILLVNLSKGQLGEERARLLGGLITTAIAQAALARARIPEHERRDFFFYCDEFQNFAAIPSMESILSEARKYRLNLTLAHQTLGQLPASLKHTITGNVGTIMAFNVSAEDASALKREMASERAAVPDLERRRTYEARAQAAARECLPAIRLDIPNRGPCVPNHGHPYECYRNALSSYHTATDPLGGKPALWPDVADFTNLDTCAAFVRVLKPTNTRFVRVPFPSTPPSDETRAAVLDRQRARHLEHQAATTPPPAGPREAQPATAPKDPDDFAF